ncbi:MAG TPA: alpha/beta hydrolase [Candidatus Binataceae bacterium]|nr:alpha/beta hydrolase [Candidatus Binataceae bacterium]
MAETAHRYEIGIEDVEYLRHGDKPLMARVFKPRGNGPFPAVVEIHGGAWCLMDRTHDTPVNEPLARSGVVVMALDFRMPPDGTYPASLADINYGIRWLKSHAEQFAIRPDLVGVMGSSSGGHQAMLTGMRPADSRYSTIPLPPGSPSVDARVRAVVMLWPVINPLGRYLYAKKLKEKGQPYPEFVDLVLPLHDKFWQSEAAMAEGNPLLALERGESVELPPALYIQGTRDIVHPRVDLDSFVAKYQKAGGQVDLQLYDNAAEGFIVRKPDSPQAAEAIQKIIGFVHKHLH